MLTRRRLLASLLAVPAIAHAHAELQPGDRFSMPVRYVPAPPAARDLPFAVGDVVTFGDDPCCWRVTAT